MAIPRRRPDLPVGEQHEQPDVDASVIGCHHWLGRRRFLRTPAGISTCPRPRARWGVRSGPARLAAPGFVKDLHQAGELGKACYGPVRGYPDEVEPAVDPVAVVERRPGGGHQRDFAEISTSSAGRVAVCSPRYSARNGAVPVASSPARCATRTSGRGQLAVHRRGRSPSDLVRAAGSRRGRCRRRVGWLPALITVGNRMYLPPDCWSSCGGGGVGAAQCVQPASPRGSK
jgi:hypothetical protein